MAYFKKDIEVEIKDSLKSIETLYKKNFINYVGKTADTKEYYSEIIASELLNKINFFDNIVSIKRESKGKSYLTKSHHDGTFSINEKSNRHEEKYAKKLFDEKNNYNSFGKIIDFQVPLKDKQNDKAGKIDLMSLNENTSTLYLIELKFGNNSETLLRAILEAYTYYKIISKDKLKNDFGLKEIKNIKPAVMVVCSDCKSFKELEDIKNRPELLKLAKKLNMTFFKSNAQATFEIISPENL
ncbi:hypothetical protein [Flavobacterium sp.]|uniref:hypothetical protein n=1 Tax=Flavobacterium sp. TaxID=239 RepID=UPI0025F27657|nr:hypothetical protein [Flavobacterium sp.]